MTSILGLDISSTQLDGCLLVDGQPPVLRRETLGKASEPLIERLRRVRSAVHAMGYRPYWGLESDSWPSPPLNVDWVVIEQPAGRYGLQALLPILGAITASVPSESQIAWRKASEWRSDLGAKNTKIAGHDAVLRMMIASRDYDEHELDAIGISLAFKRILEHPENALRETR